MSEIKPTTKIITKILCDLTADMLYPPERYAFYEIGEKGVSSNGNKDFPPIITICLLVDSHNTLSRGIAIRSKLDYPNEDGRKHALALARRAAGTKTSSHPVLTIRAWERIVNAGAFMEDSNQEFISMRNRGQLYRSEYDLDPVGIVESVIASHLRASSKGGHV